MTTDELIKILSQHPGLQIRVADWSEDYYPPKPLSPGKVGVVTANFRDGPSETFICIGAGEGIYEYTFDPFREA